MLALLVTALASFAAPRREIAPLQLADAVRYADEIVYGEVVRVETLARDAHTKADLASFDEEGWFRDGMRVAELRVERVLKSDSDPKSIAYLAQATWICDATNAVVGERGLFCFARSGVQDELRGAYAGDFERRFGTVPLFELVGAGQGKFLERGSDELRRLHTSVILPRDLPVAKVGNDDLVARDVLETRIRELVELQRAPLLSAELTWCEAPGALWHLDLARDRKATLTLIEGDARRVIPFKARSLFSLEHALAGAWLPETDRALTVSATRNERGVLELHSNSRTRRIELTFDRALTHPSPDWTPLHDQTRAVWVEVTRLLDESFPKRSDAEFARPPSWATNGLR